MVAYLTSIYQGQNPVSKIGPRNAIELRTLAEALDSLKGGDLPHVADLLMQQFKAVELATTTGNWDAARHLQLVPSTEAGLTSDRERRIATKQHLQDLKLKDLGNKQKNR